MRRSKSKTSKQVFFANQDSTIKRTTTTDLLSNTYSQYNYIEQPASPSPTRSRSPMSKYKRVASARKRKDQMMKDLLLTQRNLSRK